MSKVDVQGHSGTGRNRFIFMRLQSCDGSVSQPSENCPGKLFGHFKKYVYLQLYFTVLLNETSQVTWRQFSSGKRSPRGTQALCAQQS